MHLVADRARWRRDRVARAFRRVNFPIEAVLGEAGDSVDDPVPVGIERLTAGGGWRGWVTPAGCDVASSATTPHCALGCSATVGSDARGPVLTVSSLP